MDMNVLPFADGLRGDADNFAALDNLGTFRDRFY
jgi:hypothetical protein